MKVVVKGKIHKLLKRLVKLYNSTADPELQILYSKIALLELSGWIEETLKRMASSQIHFVHTDNVTCFQDKGRINQFSYNDFRKLLTFVIGLNGFEKLENKIPDVTKDQLRSNLSTLRNMRNSNAHTTIVGSTPIIDTPSTLIRYFELIHPCLKAFEKELKKL